MTDSLIPLLAAVSAFSNRAAEAVKAHLKAHTTFSPEVISEVALLVSLLAGVVGALALNLNLLALLPADSYLASVPPLIGVLLTGCVASIGSEGVQWVFGLLGAAQERLQTPPAQIASASLKVEAETTTAAPVIPPYTGVQPH